MAPPGGSIENVVAPEHSRVTVGDNSAHQRLQLDGQHGGGPEGKPLNLDSRNNIGLAAAQSVVNEKFPNTIIVGADKQGIGQSARDTTPGRADITDHGIQSNSALAPEANNRSLVTAHSESLATKRKLTTANDKISTPGATESPMRTGQGTATELGRRSTKESAPKVEGTAVHSIERAKIESPAAHPVEKAKVKSAQEAAHPVEKAKVKTAQETTRPREKAKAETARETTRPIEKAKVETARETTRPIEKAKVETARETTRPVEKAKVETTRETAHPVEKVKAETTQEPARQAEKPKVEGTREVSSATEKSKGDGKLEVQYELVLPQAETVYEQSKSEQKIEPQLKSETKGDSAEKSTGDVVSKNNAESPRHEAPQVIEHGAKPLEKLGGSSELVGANSNNGNPASSTIDRVNPIQTADGHSVKPTQDNFSEKLVATSHDVSNPDHLLAKTNDLTIGTDQERSSATQSRSLAQNDDDHERADLFDRLNKQSVLNNQGASVSQPVEVAQQAANYSAPVNRMDLGRSTVATPIAEASVSHSMQHVFTTSTGHAQEINRTGLRVEEFNTQNNNSTQIAASVNSTHTTAGPNQSHTGSTNHSGTTHGGGKNGQGHDPSGTAHGNAPSGQGHNPSGNGHSPVSSGPGHDPSTSGNGTGPGHDPSSTNPAGQGNDPSGAGTGNVSSGQGHNQPGQTQSSSSNDPSVPGQTQANQGSTNDPHNTQTGQHPVIDPQGHPIDPQGNNVFTGAPGTDPNNNRNGHIGGHEVIILPSYEERPMRNLVTLISEMGMALGPLHNIWSPWEETSSAHINSSHLGVHTSSHNDRSVNQDIITDQLVSLDAVVLAVNNIGVIVEQPQPVVNTHVAGEIINNGSALSSSLPNYDQLPVIETTTASNILPSDNGSNTSPFNYGSASASHSNYGANGGAIDNRSNTTLSAGINSSSDVNTTSNTNNVAPSSITQDGSVQMNQSLNGSVDYWAVDPNSGVAANTPQAIPLPSIADPIPTDSTMNNGQISESLPNHDQLVSAAEHHHGHNENIDNQDLDKNKSRTEINDPWFSEDVQKHRLQEQKDVDQVQELQHRLELITNGMGQEPNESKNGKDNKQAESKGSNNTGRKAEAKNDGLIDQFLILINDINKNKKQVSKTYVVKHGDTLESIAAKILLDSRLGILLYLVNTAQLPKSVGIEWQQIKLSEGMILYLPGDAEINSFRLAMQRDTGQNKGASNLSSETSGSQWQFDQQYLQGVEQRRRNVERLLGSLNSSGDGKCDPETGRLCVVVRFGDTLRSIALKHSTLNDVSLWKLLAQCNNLSTEVDTKGSPVAILTRGMVLQIPNEQEIVSYRNSQSAQIRAESPRKAITAEVLKVS